MTLHLENYGFLDFGCSNGLSLKFGESKLGGRNGLGVDVDLTKLEAAKRAGFNVAAGDLTEKTQFEGTVSFCLMSHFLEHLPSLKAVRNCIETAITVADQFIFIRQPWFDSDGNLFQMGLKLYWSDWTGHTSHISSSQFYSILAPYLESNDIVRFIIAGSSRIRDSSHSAIHSISAPRDQHQYDEAKHGHKDVLSFPFKVYKEIVVVVTKSLNEDPVRLAEKAGEIDVLFDSKEVALMC